MKCSKARIDDYLCYLYSILESTTKDCNEFICSYNIALALYNESNWFVKWIYGPPRCYNPAGDKLKEIQHAIAINEYRKTIGATEIEVVNDSDFWEYWMNNHAVSPTDSAG